MVCALEDVPPLLAAAPLGALAAPEGADAALRALLATPQPRAAARAETLSP